MFRSRLPEIATLLHPTVQAALKAGAERIAENARQRVPVQSGRLRDAIHVEEDDGSFYVVAGNTEVFYGHIVEHGGAHTPPRPFLVPALEENADSVLGAVTSALGRL